MSHSNVLEAAVIGIHHPKWGERPLALVVLREKNKSTTKEEIHKHLTKSFAKWQIPENIIFVEKIPRTSVGKLDKKLLRIEYRDFYTKKENLNS